MAASVASSPIFPFGIWHFYTERRISGSVPLAHFAEAALGIMAQLADNKGLIFQTLTL